MLTADDDRRDRGFTLIETIVVVAIMAIIMSALAAAITVFARTEGSVSTRLSNSRDLQNLTNFLPGDVASSSLVKSDMTGDSADLTTTVTTCGSGGAVLLHLEWTEFWTTSHESRVTYRAFPDALMPTEVRRFVCENTDPSTSIVVARSFDDVTIELQRDSGALTGTIDVRFTYPDGEFKRVTGSSRHFLP